MTTPSGSPWQSEPLCITPVSIKGVPILYLAASLLPAMAKAELSTDLQDSVWDDDLQDVFFLQTCQPDEQLSAFNHPDEIARLEQEIIERELDELDVASSQLGDSLPTSSRGAVGDHV